MKLWLGNVAQSPDPSRPPSRGRRDREESKNLTLLRALRRLRWWGWLAILLSLPALAAAWLGFELQRTVAMRVPAADVHVLPGSSVRSIAAALREAGVEVPPWEFVLAAEATHAARSLRAGRYHIEAPIRLYELLDKFRRGDVVRLRMTVVEGERFGDLRRQVAQAAELRHDTVGASDGAILAALGVDAQAAEGLFAPDTYTIDPDASDLELYRLAFRAQQDRLARAWEGRAQDLPYASPYEALIMASIIEKETGRITDRGLVAAVFVNRRRLGMPLQTDPTVIYGLGEAYDGRLHKRDLQRDSPYNTYTRPGLPPTPICLPGREAIEAALHPDPSKVLYFVARGDGSSEFSATLAEHNRAVDRFQRAAVPRPHP